MPVSEKSGKEFKNYVMDKDENTLAKAAFEKGLMPDIFDKSKHTELDGWHGPTEDSIVDRLMYDKGVNGKCVPLTHFGGFNTLGALKRVIPKLKQNGKTFHMLEDDLTYAVKDLNLITDNKKLDPINDIRPEACQLPDDLPKFHTVSSGETLYAISRKYGVPVDYIKDLNGLSSNEIEIDQQLRLIPNQVTHIVKENETLYKISKTYDVTVDQIKEWNQLQSNEIEIEQALIIKR